MPVTQLVTTVGRNSGPPTATYTLTPAASDVNEGSSITFTIGGTNIDNGSYIWTIETNAGDFDVSSGEVFINSNSGSFSVTPTADATTEGPETFTVALRSLSTSGPILVTSEPVAINDTSLDAPVPPLSLEFNQPEGDYLMVPASNDWNLGSTYTIEFWMKANNASNDGIHIPGGQWSLINQGGWYYGMPDNNSILIGLANGNLSIAQSNTDDVQYAEPGIGGAVTGVSNIVSQGGWNTGVNWSNLATTGGTGKGLTVSISGVGGGYVNAVAIVNPGHGYTSGDVVTAVGESSVSFTISTVTARKWTHVAVVNNAGTQKVFYDGVEQTKVSGTYLANGWTNTTSDLYIGRLAPNYGGHFDGKLAMVRISNAVKYTQDFTPTITYGVEADTRLFLSSDNPLVDGKAHTVTNNGVTISTNFPSAPPSPTYIITPDGDNVDEGTLFGIEFSGTNIPNGTYYWTVSNSGDFVTSSGSVNVNSNIGSFEITPTADDITEGSETFTVSWRSGSASGTILVTSDPITINDTSLTPVAHPNSFLFDGSSNYIEVQDATANWDLANGTIEFWIKPTAATGPGPGPRAIMCQQPGAGIDIFCEYGYLSMPNAQGGYEQWTEPQAGVWTHVAIVNLTGDTYVWYNGIFQSHKPCIPWNNTGASIYIGRRQGDYQYFDGKLTGIRINEGSVYLNDPYNITDFDPLIAALPPTINEYTRLLLNPTDLVMYDDLSGSNHTLAPSGVGTSSDYPGNQSVLVRQYLYGFARNSSNGSLYYRYIDSYVASYIPVGARTDYAGGIYTVVGNVGASGSPYLQGSNGQQIYFDNGPDIYAGDYLTFTWQGTTQYDISNNSGATLGTPIENRFQATLPDGAVFYWRVEDGYSVPFGFDGDTSGSFTLSANKATVYVTATDMGMSGSDGYFTVGFYTDPGYTNQVATINATVTNQNGP
jgi:hypothetical protein